MLKRLSVSNLAIVEKAEAEFACGLNVLTGETGAGKSVLMGALELVLGGRADPEAVREGAREALVDAEFSLSGSDGSLVDGVNGTLEEAGLPRCEEGELLVRRSISSGGGRVWINDSPSTVGTLRKLGKLLVDIHGPRANQNILEEAFQRDVLDRFGAVNSKEYAAAYAKLSGLRKELAELEGGAEIDEEMLRYQVEELASAELTEEDETISERHTKAAHAREILGDANEITETLGGDGGIADLLVRLQPKFREMAKHFPSAEEWASQAEEITIGVQELSRAIADGISGFDASDEDLEALDARLTTVNRLKRKYAVARVADLMELLDAKAAKLDAAEHREERMAELNGAIAAAEAEVRKAGAALTKRRKIAGTKIGKAVTAELHDLGFLQAEFSVAIEPIEPEAHGCDGVTYMFGPNPGEPTRPLADIASSGEMARVMLALKGVLSEHDSTDVLVFDEIDANIGGEVGTVVGVKMRAVSKHRQVIAITHLPQCAACGDRHLVVSKAVSGGRTRTMISEAEGNARVDEIARMLGGAKNKTGVVRKHAEELLRISSGD